VCDLNMADMEAIYDDLVRIAASDRKYWINL
jgi:hypothetical protein